MDALEFGEAHIVELLRREVGRGVELKALRVVLSTVRKIRRRNVIARMRKILRAEGEDIFDSSSFNGKAVCLTRVSKCDETEVS